MLVVGGDWLMLLSVNGFSCCWLLLLAVVGGCNCCFWLLLLLVIVRVVGVNGCVVFVFAFVIIVIVVIGVVASGG